MLHLRSIIKPQRYLLLKLPQVQCKFQIPLCMFTTKTRKKRKTKDGDWKTQTEEEDPGSVTHGNLNPEITIKEIASSNEHRVIYICYFV